MSLSIDGARQAWNRFFFAPTNLSQCGIFRIAYASLLLINILVWWPDLERWFGEHGVLGYEASRTVIDPDTWTLFAWLPKTDGVLWGCYLLLIGHTFLLLVGLFTRFQAACVFVWFTSFQHRNLLLFDGEDYLFRILAFLLIFLPAGNYWSLDRLRPSMRRLSVRRLCWHPVWPLRLAQIQITLVYVSTVWEKLRGADWLDGLAAYYVSRLDDVFGRFPVPSIFLESLFVMKLLTWAVLAVECVLPIGLWFKETRRWAICLGVALHLALEYTMNLFLFHWLMITCLILFIEGTLIRQGLAAIKARRPH